jgi:filamentous hemagglutinin family protein
VSKALSSWLGLSLCTLGYLCATNNPASAQVTSDGTVNTQVTENGNTAEITGGERAGDNLFHSFQDFSVETGNEASFLNANDISNIFSRVTGGNISNIDGLISANGSANLFLINPAGIVFREGARLDIGGSFYGSTADSILFEDGEFSATDLSNPPVLTINAPIGLNLRDQPGDIVNRSTAINPDTKTQGLEVDPENNINLVGGNINFEGGRLNAPAGKVQLGGLSTAGTVGITDEGNLSFPDDIARGNISLTQEAFIGVTGTRGGDIGLTAADIQIGGGSFLQGGTFADVGLADSQSGNIDLNATGAINVNGSTIDNSVGIGNAGAIEISAISFSLINDGTIINSTFGQGNAGNIRVNAIEDVSLDTGDIFSNVGSQNISQAEGNAGEIVIDANSISLTNGAQIQSSVFDGGLGNGNNVTLNARSGNVTISGNDQLASGIFTDVETIDSSNSFNAGNIKIDAQDSILLNNASIRNANAGTGFAGNIELNAPNEISIKDSIVSADGNYGFIAIGNTVQPSQVTLEGERTEIEDGTNFAFSNELNTTSSNPDDLLGGISINARDRISITDSNIDSETRSTRTTNIDGQEGLNFSIISLNVEGEDPQGNISLERSRINTSNSSTGYAGDINLNARAEIKIVDTSILSTGQLARIFIQSENGNVFFDNSNVFSNVEAEGSGFAGNINITANSISFLNSSQLQSSNLGSGNGGNIALNARENIVLSGRNSNNLTSAIFTDSTSSGDGTSSGDAGNIQVNVSDGSLSLSDGATLYSGYNGLVDAGESNAGESNAGEITIDADLVSLDGNSIISTQAFGDRADGGNLKIDANYIIAFPNNGTGNDLVSAAAQGRGGNIDLTVEQLFGLEIGEAINDKGVFNDNDNNDIDASSGDEGFDGTININTSDINPVQGATELPSNVVELEQNTAQACEASRGTANNGLAIAGKGGVTPTPDAPLNSENIISPEQNPAAYAIPEPIETSQGKIQPARGIKVTKSGNIILTAYRTNNAGERIPNLPNCNSY